MTGKREALMSLLGGVAYWSADLEWMLRLAFSTLVGSELTADLPAGKLIKECQALTDTHPEIPATKREAIKTALTNCKSALRKRNKLIHGVEASFPVGDDGSFTTRSIRNRELEVKDWTPAMVREVSLELEGAGTELLSALVDAGLRIRDVVYSLPAIPET